MPRAKGLQSRYRLARPKAACETSASLLRKVTDSLGARLSDLEAAVLFERHRGNLRDAIRELYDQWSEGAAM